jgi:protein gp37
VVVAPCGLGTRELKGKDVDWPDNVVAMTSVIDKATAKGVEQLRKVRAKIKGLSVEPLWEPVELELADIFWVICGGESGSGKNSAPFHLEWARALRHQCKKAGVAFFMKQLGSNAFESGQSYNCQAFMVGNGVSGLRTCASVSCQQRFLMLLSLP